MGISSLVFGRFFLFFWEVFVLVGGFCSCGRFLFLWEVFFCDKINDDTSKKR